MVFVHYFGPIFATTLALFFTLGSFRVLKYVIHKIGYVSFYDPQLRIGSCKSSIAMFTHPLECTDTNLNFRPNIPL